MYPMPESRFKEYAEQSRERHKDKEREVLCDWFMYRTEYSLHHYYVSVSYLKNGMT